MKTLTKVQAMRLIRSMVMPDSDRITQLEQRLEALERLLWQHLEE